MLVELFAAIPPDPLAFTTCWIWAADITESITTTAVQVPLCMRYPLLTTGYQCLRDFLLATLPLPHCRAFEVYERNEQRATFLDLGLYMGGVHLAKLGVMLSWWCPDPKIWRAAMALTSFIDNPCNPVGHADYMRFVTKQIAREVTPHAWTTRAQARELLNFRDQGVEEDDELASKFLCSVKASVGLLSPPSTPGCRTNPLNHPSVADTARSDRAYFCGRICRSAIRYVHELFSDSGSGGRCSAFIVYFTDSFSS